MARNIDRKKLSPAIWLKRSISRSICADPMAWSSGKYSFGQMGQWKGQWGQWQVQPPTNCLNQKQPASNPENTFFPIDPSMPKIIDPAKKSYTQAPPNFLNCF